MPVRLLGELVHLCQCLLGELVHLCQCLLGELVHLCQCLLGDTIVTGRWLGVSREAGAGARRQETMNLVNSGRL